MELHKFLLLNVMSSLPPFLMMHYYTIWIFFYSARELDGNDSEILFNLALTQAMSKKVRKIFHIHNDIILYFFDDAQLF